MNKRILISIIAAVVVVGGAGAALAVTYNNNKESARQQNAAESEKMATRDQMSVEATIDEVTPAPVTSEPTQTAKAGTYINYSEDVIANTSGEKVLFFHAPWCPQCREIDSDIKAQFSLPENTTIIKVDYDSNQKLRQKYGVTLQTTFVKVDDSGNGIQKYVAYNEPNFASVKKNILE